jgi:hypothetical protein
LAYSTVLLLLIGRNAVASPSTPLQSFLWYRPTYEFPYLGEWVLILLVWHIHHTIALRRRGAGRRSIVQITAALLGGLVFLISFHSSNESVAHATFAFLLLFAHSGSGYSS